MCRIFSRIQICIWCQRLVQYFHPIFSHKLSTEFDLCLTFRDQPSAVRGPAAGAGAGHALCWHLQREAGQGRHQGGRAHQAAPQGKEDEWIKFEDDKGRYYI